MKYMKPRITDLGAATAAIQMLDKEPGPMIDSDRLEFTTNAYQADE